MSAAEEKSQEEQGARQPAPIGRWKTDLIDLIARAPTRRESIKSTKGFWGRILRSPPQIDAAEELDENAGVRNFLRKEPILTKRLNLILLSYFIIYLLIVAGFSFLYFAPLPVLGVTLAAVAVTPAGWSILLGLVALLLVAGATYLLHKAWTWAQKSNWGGKLDFNISLREALIARMTPIEKYTEGPNAGQEIQATTEEVANYKLSHKHESLKIILSLDDLDSRSSMSLRASTSPSTELIPTASELKMEAKPKAKLEDLLPLLGELSALFDKLPSYPNYPKQAAEIRNLRRAVETSIRDKKPEELMDKLLELDDNLQAYLLTHTKEIPSREELETKFDAFVVKLLQSAFSENPAPASQEFFSSLQEDLFLISLEDSAKLLSKKRLEQLDPSVIEQLFNKFNALWPEAECTSSRYSQVKSEIRNNLIEVLAAKKSQAPKISQDKVVAVLPADSSSRLAH